MIQSDYKEGKVIISCDEPNCDICQDFNYSGQGSFKLALADAKLAGWRVAFKDDVFEHYCSDCVAEFIRKKRSERNQGNDSADVKEEAQIIKEEPVVEKQLLFTEEDAPF